MSGRGDWRPTASRETLALRAAVLSRIRAFFDGRGVLEVTTPAISRAATTEPNIHSRVVQSPGAGGQPPLYLHTSPELAMKRLVASGSGPVYQVCTVFRDDNTGRRHRPEFTMLEWYRPGWTYWQLIEEVEQLLQCVADQAPLSAGPPAPCTHISYRALFREMLDLDPMNADADECRECCRRHNLAVPDNMGTEPGPWLDLLMSLLIEPRLSDNALTVIYDFPAQQAALARIRNEPDGAVAERFEVYWGDIELANGFQELTDADEQKRRFDRENEYRHRHNLPVMPLDRRFLDALHAGMPECSGVALGVDRLLMAVTGSKDIRDVIAFADELSD